MTKNYKKEMIKGCFYDKERRTHSFSYYGTVFELPVMNDDIYALETAISVCKADPSESIRIGQLKDIDLALVEGLIANGKLLNKKRYDYLWDLYELVDACETESELDLIVWDFSHPVIVIA